MAVVQPLELRLQPDASRYTLARFIADVADRHEDRVALRFPTPQGDDSEYTYREIEQAARRLAKGLIASGVVKGARVAIYMSNRPEWVISAFAVAMTGAVIVPLNTFATREDRDYILRHSDASVLLMQPGLLKHRFLDDLLVDHPEVATARPGQIFCEALPNLRRVACLGEDVPRGGVESWSALAHAGDSISDALLDAIIDEIHPADDGIIIYTSGTTAHPKGVLHFQRAPVIHAWRYAELFGWDESDVLWTSYPFFWSAGIAMSLGGGFAAGMTVLLAETFDPESGLEQIERFGATLVHAWPHQEKALAEHPTAKERDLRSITKVNFASPLAPLAGCEEDTYGTSGSYGMTETFTLCTAIGADAAPRLRAETSGIPLGDMDVAVVDVEDGTELPTGEKGEVVVKGVTLMRGYYKVAPELVFDANGYFHSQDGGHFDEEHHLYWTGRISNLIKTGGANVSPLEIEAYLRTYPGLRAGLVVGVPHPVLGEVIVLCAVPTEGSTLDPEALMSYLRDRLAAYKRPKLVLTFSADELSFTGSQKIQVGPLRERALARMGEQGIEIDGVKYERAK